MFEKLLPKIDLTQNPEYDNLYETITSDETTDEERQSAQAAYNVMVAAALQQAKETAIKRAKAVGVLIGATVIVGVVVLLAASGSDEESEEDEETEEESEPQIDS